MKYLLPILCLFGLLFSDTIYLSNNTIIEDVEYLGYNYKKIIFDMSNQEFYVYRDNDLKIVNDKGYNLTYLNREYKYKFSNNSS